MPILAPFESKGSFKPFMYDTLADLLRSQAVADSAFSFARFFKPGHSDHFLGVKTAVLRKIAKDHHAKTELSDLLKLMNSHIYEERALASHLLVTKYQKAADLDKQKIVDFYLQNKEHIHDWSNVDNTAPYILGPHLLNRDKKILYSLAESKRIWDRRIAIVATWWFIRNGEFDTTIAIAEKFLQDKEDLIQKATGWMLREMGKKNQGLLEDFLEKHAKHMPRITLSYALEKFPKEKRALYQKR